MRLTRLVTLLAAALLVVLLLDAVADAQRRRRRRRPPPPPPTEQVEEPAQAQGEAEAQRGSTPPAASTEGEGGAAAGGSPEATDASAPAPAREGSADSYEDYAPIGPDLGPLRTEFTTIMDELVSVRSRMAVLGRQLFQTKVRIVVQNRAGGRNTLARLVVSLDGAPVHRGDGSALAAGGQQVFEGFAAPGPHVLTLEAEQRQRADDDYRYTIRDSFRFTVLRERLTEVTLVLDDDSDMGADFEDDGEAEYEVTTRMRVATRELPR